MLTFATRPSALARWQTDWVIRALQQAHPGLECTTKIITTQGDRVLDKALPEIGGKGLFTQELESELLSGQVDCAVHSLKDLPVESPDGLVIAAIPERAEVRDVLISAHGYTLDTLPQGAIIGTSSRRRAAQLLHLRPDLRIENLRGNVDTRLRKALEGRYDAVIMAAAGLSRLGLEKAVTQYLPLEAMLPAPGQGALAVQCRAADQETRSYLAAIDHMPTRRAVTAERAFLQGLGGGCALPIAAFAEVTPTGRLHLIGRVLSPDGQEMIEVQGEADDALALGHELAQQALTRGASRLLRVTAS